MKARRMATHRYHHYNMVRRLSKRLVAAIPHLEALRAEAEARFTEALEQNIADLSTARGTLEIYEAYCTTLERLHILANDPVMYMWRTMHPTYDEDIMEEESYAFSERRRRRHRRIRRKYGYRLGE